MRKRCILLAPSMVLLAALLASRLIFAGQPAQADIVLCPKLPSPATMTQALDRSAFAFDGVAVGGREIPSPNRLESLVSPLTFRVVRWVKGSFSLWGDVLPSGAVVVRIWDARYGHLPKDLLQSYSLKVDTRFSGEMIVAKGQEWRIFAANEDGINYTCTEYLGSHEIAAERTQSSPSAIAAPARSSGDSPFGWIVVAVGLLVVLGLLGASRVARRRAGARET